MSPLQNKNHIKFIQNRTVEGQMRGCFEGLCNGQALLFAPCVIFLPSRDPKLMTKVRELDYCANISFGP